MYKIIYSAIEFIAEALDPDSGDTQDIDYKWFIRGVNETSKTYIKSYFRDLAAEFNVAVDTMYKELLFSFSNNSEFKFMINIIHSGKLFQSKILKSTGLS